MALLEVKNLSFSYPIIPVSDIGPEKSKMQSFRNPNMIEKNSIETCLKKDEKALFNISFSIERGDFVAVCGATGSGKSTLLRMLKPELAPLGEKSGTVNYLGKTLDSKHSYSKIGFVMQRPEQQIVTDRVWHELALGLENIGVPSETIRRRVSEMACYFGIEEWFCRDTNSLSGGQKQLLNLASIMVMQPDILILDEPTAQLDPIAASDFINTLAKLNSDLSLTVIIAEHRLEDVIPVSNKLLALQSGSVLTFGETRTAAKKLSGYPELIMGMPAAFKLYSRLGKKDDCPFTVRDGRKFIERHFCNTIKSLDEKKYTHAKAPALEFSDVYFRYSRNSPDILKGLSFSVYEGETVSVLGGNGSGKSTMLGVAAGINKIYQGHIKIFGKPIENYKNQSLYRECVSLLPQDVQTVFLKNTVKEELIDALRDDITSFSFDLAPLYDRHPYDLSGGQQQLVALAKVLSTNPRLLLLDEPTKGLDAATKAEIGKIIQALRSAGITIVIVTHDIEFAAEYSDRCALLFRGEITSCGTPREFFSGNSFYTTAQNKMTRGYYNGIVTLSDAEKICRLNELNVGE